MYHLRVGLALCLLGLLAPALAEVEDRPTAQTEQDSDNDNSDRKQQEAIKTLKQVLHRQRRFGECSYDILFEKNPLQKLIFDNVFKCIL